jgi:hypothetical protein
MKYIEIKEQDGSYSYFYYIPNFLDMTYIRTLTSWLQNMKDFNTNLNYNEDAVIRYQKWYQKDKNYFCDKWKNKYKRWDAFTYNEILEELETYILERLRDEHFEELGIPIPNLNSVLIQKYVDGNHYISQHRDTDKSFG